MSRPQAQRTRDIQPTAPRIVGLPGQSRIALPARWTAWQRYKNTLIYWLIRATAWLLGALPIAAIGPCSRVLGTLAYLVAPRQRRVALRQMQSALPTMPAYLVRRQVRDMFVHLGHSALELGKLPAYLRGKHAIPLSDEARAVYDAALQQGRGVIVVTGHIGNWELLAQVVAHRGYDLTTLAKRAYDPRLTAFIENQRRRHGLHVIWREQADAAARMLKVLRRGGMLAMLIDQDTRVDGVWVPFFGRLAYTPTAPAALARRLRCPLLVSTIRRGEHGHQIDAAPIQVQITEDRAADVAKLTEGLTRRLQAAIVAAPSQWVWLHQRWRHSPPKT